MTGSQGLRLHTCAPISGPCLHNLLTCADDTCRMQGWGQFINLGVLILLLLIFNKYAASI